MKVMPAETRNSQDANPMPSIRMIGRIFMRRVAPLFSRRPAFDPFDRLLALRRNHLSGREDAELVENRIAELGMLLAGSDAPHRLVHTLMILAHEDAPARGVELEAFHRGRDLLVGRPAPVLRLGGLLDRGLQSVEGLRHER